MNYISIISTSDYNYWNIRLYNVTFWLYIIIVRCRKYFLRFCSGLLHIL